MKKLVTYLLCIVMLLCLTTPVLANSQELRFSSAMTVEDYVDELIRVFPEANLNKIMLITPQINDSVMTIPTTARETYSKTIDGNRYTLRVYRDDFVGLLIENKEEYVSRSTWNKLFSMSTVCMGYDSSWIYLRVYYNFTGQATEPQITSTLVNLDLATLVDSGYSSVDAFVKADSYFEEEGILGHRPKFYYMGMQLSVFSEYGHTFSTEEIRQEPYSH